MTERKPTCVACKGAGGANYTAGTGIVIENNEISADTTVLQPKLTAGTGISITDNVIYAEDGTYVKVEDTDWSKLNLFDNTTKTILRDCIIAFANNGAVMDILKFKKGYGGTSGYFSFRRPYFILARYGIAGGNIDPSVDISEIFNSTGEPSVNVGAGGGTDGLYLFSGYSNGILIINNLRGYEKVTFYKSNPFNSHSGGVGIVLFIKE